MKLLRVMIALGAGWAIAAGCGGRGGEPTVTDAEAQAVLDSVIAWAGAGADPGECSNIGAPEPTCRIHLGFNPVTERPVERPVVIESIDAPSGAVPGRLLILCGTDALGRQFETGFLVYRYDKRYAVPYPVYWSGTPVGLPAKGTPGVATTAAQPGGTDRAPGCRAAGVF
ncbi:MAG: hypothetical protein ACKVT1_01425 [Dehalococcoidia bacterium]